MGMSWEEPGAHASRASPAVAAKTLPWRNSRRSIGLLVADKAVHRNLFLFVARDTPVHLENLVADGRHALSDVRVARLAAEPGPYVPFMREVGELWKLVETPPTG